MTVLARQVPRGARTLFESFTKKVRRHCSDRDKAALTLQWRRGVQFHADV